MITYIKTKPRLILGGLIALFVGLRLLVLLSGGMHAFEAEELYRGVIGREIIDGLKMPFWDYQADHYSGGSLLVGLAAAPFFMLLGPSLFALKLAPLLFALLTLIFLWGFMRRYFGLQAAVFSSLFFILAPPAFIRLSLVAMGFHSESILFSVLTLCFFYRYFYEAQERKFLFLFGLLSGFGFWFTHITAIVPLACLGTWFFLNPKSLFCRRNMILFFEGAFLGLLPWFIYNFTHHFEGVGFILRNLIRFSGASGSGEPSAFSFNFKRLGQLVLTAIPSSFAFENLGGIPRQIFCRLYFLIGCAFILPLYARFGAAAFRRKNRLSDESRLLPVLLIPLVFILCYWLSSVEINAVAEPEFFYLFFDDCRYFVPFHFAFFILLGIGCSGFNSSVSGSLLKKAAAVSIGLFGILALMTVSFVEPWGSVLHYKGYAYSQLGALRGHIWPQRSPNFEKHLESLERYKMPDRFFVFWNSLYGLQFEKDLNNPEKIKRLMNEVPVQYRPHMAQGIGYGIGAQGGLHAQFREAVLKLIPAEYHSFFYLGFVDSTMGIGTEKVEDFLRFASTLPGEVRGVFYFEVGHICPYEMKKDGLDFILKRPNHETDADLKSFFRGIGVRCMINWIFDGFTFEKAVKNLGFDIPAQYQDDFYWGVGWGLCHQTAEDRPRAAAMLDEIPKDRREQVLSGFNDCVKSYAIPE